jgi:STE24 endopeptidase
MSLRTSLLLLLAGVVLLVLPSRLQQTTPTEAQALQAAAHTPASSAFYTLPPDKLKLATGLFRMRTVLYFVGSLWGVLQIILLLWLKIPARMRSLAESVTKNRWAQCFLFVFLFFLLTTLLNAPLRIYGHHLGLAYGLSVQGWVSWIADWGKSFLLSWLVMGLLVKALFWIIRRSPKNWWFWFWIPTMAAVLFGVYLSPILVDPLFDKFEPLQQVNPALVRQLEKVVARSGVSLPPDRMFFMRASQKVTGLNAYVTGFGPSKRLVLWDTTIAQSTPDELSGIFGHELGHYALHHIAFGVLFAAAALLLAFFVGQRITQALLRRFGTAWGIRSQEDWACLAVLMLVLNGLSFFSAPIENSFSRSIEHAADVYGQEAIHGIVANPQTSTVQGFQRLGEASLEDPTPHPFLEFWTFSHPSVGRRAAFSAFYNPWAKGQHPKFFSDK